VLTAGSGFPYSPMKVYNEVTLGAISPEPTGPINSRYTPWTYRIDLKADREIPIKGWTLDVYLWVINVLNRKNVADVYESSGAADYTGWLETGDGLAFIADEATAEAHDSSYRTAEEKYLVKQADPRNYDTPRQIRFGVRWSF
jgi:hypothetical protein